MSKSYFFAVSLSHVPQLLPTLTMTSQQQLPAFHALTADDLRASAYDAILRDVSPTSYTDVHAALSAARKAHAQSAHASAFSFLDDIMSMMLTADTPGVPFKPLIEWGNRRSAIPGDFRDHVDLLVLLSEEAEHRLLRARVADLVWLLDRKRGVRFANLAIEAYRQLPAQPATWMEGERSNWMRALQLAAGLGKAGAAHIAAMEAALLQAFDEAQDDGEHRNAPHWFSDALYRNNLARPQALHLADKLAGIGRDMSAAGDLPGARGSFERAGRWYKKADDAVNAVEMTVAMAESWADEAQQRLRGPTPSSAVAASYYEKAIQLLRSVPAKARRARNIAHRIDVLRQAMNAAGEHAIGEMHIITTKGPDVRAQIAEVRQAVKGKTAVDALLHLTAIYHGPAIAEHRASAEQRAQESPISALFSTTLMSPDGRVIAARPGASVDDTADMQEAALLASMVDYFAQTIMPKVAFLVQHALDEVRFEHALTLDDFVALARNSPLVPPERAYLFGKGLYAGYSLDFTTALHILVPQIEHLVRFHLQNAGEHTATFIDGISDEMGLSSLIGREKMVPVFGVDRTFEVRALFCDRHGPNLRNLLAHGLLSDGACQSNASVYAWFFALRTVFAGFWNAHRPAQEESNPEQNGPSPDDLKKTAP